MPDNYTSGVLVEIYNVNNYCNIHHVDHPGNSVFYQEMEVVDLASCPIRQR
jgi:hypothetical protein